MIGFDGTRTAGLNLAGAVVIEAEIEHDVLVCTHGWRDFQAQLGIDEAGRGGSAMRIFLIGNLLPGGNDALVLLSRQHTRSGQNIALPGGFQR